VVVAVRWAELHYLCSSTRVLRSGFSFSLLVSVSIIVSLRGRGKGRAGQGNPQAKRWKAKPAAGQDKHAAACCAVVQTMQCLLKHRDGILSGPSN
jgi:hypothetical protein